MRDSFTRKKIKKPSLSTWYFLCLWVALVLGQSTGWSAVADDKDIGTKVQSSSNIEEKWGVKIVSIRLTAAGKMLDYRFRVVDPDKAMALMKRGDNAYLIDQATGKKMPVPRTKVGPMRQTGSKPKKGFVYPILFTNLGRIVKPGSKVTVVLGDFRVENLIVGADIPQRAKLPQAKQAQWEAAQQRLRNEMGSCIADCGQDRDCFRKCEKAHKSRLEKEYQKLLYEK